jgi:hypothetical protein
MSTKKTNKDKTVTEEKQELRKFRHGGNPFSPDYNHPPERYIVTDVPGGAIFNPTPGPIIPTPAPTPVPYPMPLLPVPYPTPLLPGPGKPVPTPVRSICHGGLLPCLLPWRFGYTNPFEKGGVVKSVSKQITESVPKSKSMNKGGVVRPVSKQITKSTFKSTPRPKSMNRGGIVRAASKSAPRLLSGGSRGGGLIARR